MALPITTVGEPVLRLSARILDRDEIRSHAIQDLIAHMRDTMYAAPGVGLAAPQVGHSLQLAVIEDKPEYHAKLDAEQLAIRERTPVPFHVIINPVLESCSIRPKQPSSRDASACRDTRRLSPVPAASV